MSTKPFPKAMVAFARSPEGEGMVLIGPEALMSVCPVIHASSSLSGHDKAMPQYSMVFSTEKSQEILQQQQQEEQRRQQQEQRRGQHRGRASAVKGQETLQQGQRKQTQQRAQAFKRMQPRLTCRPAHAPCFSRGLQSASVPSRFRPPGASRLLG